MTMQPRINSRYHLLDRLGAGGMGEVYRANDRLTGAQVALKRVMADVADLDFLARHTVPTDDPRLALAHEFQMLASLRHPHVIPVLDYGFDDAARPFFTMPLLEDAQPITQAAAGLSLDERLDLLLQTLLALVYIHRRGLLHRDIKPSNVLVRQRHVYLLDFGLAQSQEHAADGAVVAGTLAYMAPEVLLGNPPTQAADLYAMGVIAYELIGGSHPYPTETASSLIEGILHQPVDLAVLDATPSLAAVVGRLLAKDPADRYPDAAALIHVLSEAVGRPVPPETQAIRESFLQAAAFIGRRDELRMLSDDLGQLRQGRGAVRLVGGESGVGKSRLMDELAIRAQVEGVMVLRAQATTEPGQPFYLWQGALRRLALELTLSDDEIAGLRPAVSDIAALVGRDANEAASPKQEDIGKRLALLLDDLLRRVAAQRPVLLLIEDLQWVAASAPDMDLLRAVLRATQHAPLMLLGTFRDDEAPDLPAALGDAPTLTLQRLAPAEIEQLSVAMLGRAGQRQQVLQLLQKETEGNVFFLIEVVRALAEDAGTISDIGEITLPERIFAGGVQRIVMHRLGQVPDWAVPMMQLTAVAGRQIDPALVAMLDPTLDLDAWLTACTNAALFTQADGRFQFAHDKLREGALAQLDHETLAQAHARVAAAIEAAYPDQREDFAARLFYHYGMAGDTVREGQYAVLAGQAALRGNDYHEARRCFQRALALDAHQHAPDPQRQQADIAQGLARAAYGLSDYDTTRTWGTQAETLYTALGDDFGVSNAINVMGEADFRQGHWATARERIERGLALRRALGQRLDEGYSLMNLGVIAAQTGEPEAALAFFQQSHEILDAVGEPISQARALNNLGIMYESMGDSAAALDHHTRSLAIREAINDRQGIAYSRANIAGLHESEGRLDEALRGMELAITLLQSVGDRQALAISHARTAQVLVKLGRLDEAEAHEQQALTIRREIATSHGIASSLIGLSSIALARQDPATAWDYVRQALDLALKKDQIAQQIDGLLNVAEIHAQERRAVDAAALMRYLLDHPAVIGQQRDHIESLLAPLRDLLGDAVLDAAARQHAGRDLADLVREVLAD